jgi:hypothetical protein
MIVKSQFKKWKWKFTKDQYFVLPDSSIPERGKTYAILSNSGNPVVSLRNGMLRIHRHYHFNGADYAPDFKGGLPHYAKHDAMCQLAEKYPEITREMADEVLNPSHITFPPLHLWIYYPAVKLYSKFTKKDK